MPILLESKVSELNKVGKAMSSRLKRLGIETVRDLIFYYPFRYDDFSRRAKIKELEPGAVVTVAGQIELIESKRSPRKRKIITEALLTDDTGSVKIIWFNQPWIGKTLKAGDNLMVSGKVSGDLFNIYFSSPNYEKMTQERTNTGGLVPVYPLTEGLTQKQIRFLIRSVIPAVESLPDYLPAGIISNEKLWSLGRALREVHFPGSAANLHSARHRLGFDELFLLQLWSQLNKKQLKQERAPAVSFFSEETKRFVSQLPFALTADQKKAAWEIIKDLDRGQPMNRLLEGDVGSGKTLVALLAMYNAALGGWQSALMAPTEILAGQHYKNIAKLMEPWGINVGLLTRTQKLFNGKKLAKREFLNQCREGGLALIIGTHALIQKEVEFKDLALVVIDEQHRFGVEQRKALKQKAKGKVPHFLSLTATPIPRSLSLIVYGDLDLSIIREMPAGRKEIITKVVAPANRQAAYEFIAGQIAAGRQVFVICPLIDPSDKLGVRSVKEEFEKLDKQIFPHLAVGLLHGKLPSEEKERVLGDFAANRLKLLVATSVVEVGIDIPNATVMMIEGAERFGLAQLHQFRGRVGRSGFQSYCFLFSDILDPLVLERLNYLAVCHDGFVLANKDLELRGAGNVFGAEQSGFLNAFKIADLGDLGLIAAAKKAAEDLLRPAGDLADYPLLQRQLKSLKFSGHFE